VRIFTPLKQNHKTHTRAHLQCVRIFSLLKTQTPQHSNSRAFVMRADLYPTKTKPQNSNSRAFVMRADLYPTNTIKSNPQHLRSARISLQITTKESLVVHFLSAHQYKPNNLSVPNALPLLPVRCQSDYNEYNQLVLLISYSCPK